MGRLHFIPISALTVKMSKLRVALVVLGDALLCTLLVLLVQIDNIVNSTLYDYGLVFSDNWAQPYWLMLRVSMVLIVVIIFTISFAELPVPILEEKKERDEKPREKAVEVETEVAVEGEVEEEDEGTTVSIKSSK